MADLICAFSAIDFSMYIDSRSSSASRIPPCSPASIRLQYSESKYFGWRRKACAMLLPDSMSTRISVSSWVKFGLAWPRAMMSTDCSSGTPAFSMVDSWRVK